MSKQQKILDDQNSLVFHLNEASKIADRLRQAKLQPISIGSSKKNHSAIISKGVSHIKERRVNKAS